MDALPICRWPPPDQCDESQIQDEVKDVIRKCLARIRSWPVPRNWSIQDWSEETREVAIVAAWKAVSASQSAAASPYPWFVQQRVISVVRTRYRQEFLYGARFGTAFVEDAGDADEQAAERVPDYVDLSAEPIRYGDLSEAIAKLSKVHRETIEQLFWGGQTEAELAKSLGLSQRGISKRKQAALRVLRSFL